MKVQYPLANIDGTSVDEDAREFTRFCETKGAGSVRLFRDGRYMPSHNVGNQIRKRVQFTRPPNSKRRAPIRLNHTQHLAQPSSNIGKEPHPQPAYRRIERIVCEWQ